MGACIWLFGFVIDIFTVDWSFGKYVREGFPALEGKEVLFFDLKPWSGTNRISLALILLSVSSIGYARMNGSKLKESLPNPFLLIPESTRNTVARTSFYLTKAFSVRSAFLLIIAGLLGELAVAAFLHHTCVPAVVDALLGCQLHEEIPGVLPVRPHQIQRLVRPLRFLMDRKDREGSR